MPNFYENICCYNPICAIAKFFKITQLDLKKIDNTFDLYYKNGKN